MQNFSTTGLTKAQMARLSGVTPTTIRKYTEELKLTPFPDSSPKKQVYSIPDVRKVLQRVVVKKYPIHKKIHAFFNFKGGVGKTTFAYQISSLLAVLGYRVLAIDTDPQYNLTTAFGVYLDPETGEHIPEEEMTKINTLYDVIAQGLPIQEAILSIYEGLDIIPSNLSLTRLDQQLFTTTRREEQLNDLLKSVKNDYDFIIIDANPSISNTNLNALNAADIINVVSELQVFSLSSTDMLLTELQEFFVRKMKKRVPTINIIPNKYTPKDVSSLRAAMALKESFPEYIRPAFHVRQSSDFNRSSAEMNPLVFMSNKNSNAFEDILETVDEIIYLSSEEKERAETANTEAA